MHANMQSLTGQTGFCVLQQCPHNDTLWPAAPPSGCCKPMSTGYGPSPQPLRNPPSWTDSSCYRWAITHTQRKDQLLRHCPELSHLASPNRQLIKCVCVHASMLCVCMCMYHVARMKTVGGAASSQRRRIRLCQAAQRVSVPIIVVNQVFLNTHTHSQFLCSVIIRHKTSVINF